MVVMMLVLLMIVVMVMMVLMLVMIVVVIVMMLMLLMIVIMVMLIMVLVVMIVMMVVMLVLLVVGGLLGGQARQLLLQAVLVLHGLEDQLARQLRPRGGDDGRVRVVLAQELDGVEELLLLHPVRAAEDDGRGVLDLIVEELAEVLHVDLALGRVRHGDEGVQLQVVVVQTLHRADDVGELAHAGRLDDDAVRLELGHHLLERLAEVAHQAAADAAGVHLGDLDPGVLQEPAVDADLTELVLDEDQLLALVRLLDQLFDEGGLTGPQEPGEYVDLGHSCVPPYDLAGPRGTPV